MRAPSAFAILVAAIAVTTPSAGATASGPSAQAPTVAPFNLGLVEIPQPGTGRFAVYPTELKGVIGVPPGANRRPIVVILHGRHGTGCPEIDDLDTWPCPAVERRHDLGFRYLVTALAGRGFVAISINVNAADTNGWGEPRENRTEQILRRVLDRLAVANGGGANGFGVPLAGRIDFARLGLIGHSQRGARSVVIARNRARSPGPVDAGRGPIRAMLLLAPVYVPRKVPRSTAFALVLPQCDNDVVNLEGLGYFDRIGRERRTRAAALLYLRRANHNFFNAALADEGGHSRPGCVPRSRRLSKVAQTAWLARYAPAFFRAALGAAPAGGAANLNAAVPPRRYVFGRRVLTSIAVPAADRLVVQHPSGPASVRRTATGGRVSVTPGVTVAFCRAGRRPCRPGLWQPVYPRQLSIAWNELGAMLTNSLGAPRDVRAFDAVRLRIALDPTSRDNPRWRPQAFSLVLRDSRGRSAAAPVRKTAPALGFPPGRFGPGTAERSYVISSDVRVPLGRFKGIDLRRLAAVALRFDRTPTGSILLAGLELVRRGRPG